MPKRKTIPESNLSRYAPGEEMPKLNREPGDDDATRVMHSIETDAKEGRSG